MMFMLWHQAINCGTPSMGVANFNPSTNFSITQLVLLGRDVSIWPVDF
jgi:hypothetical protein